MNMPFVSALLFCLGTPSLLAGSWPGVPYAEVRAYAWPETEFVERVIDADGKPLAGALNPDGARLSKSQVRRVIAAQKRPLGKIMFKAGCYYPHHAFVFFDRRGRAVASLEVCFSCYGSDSRPKAQPRSDPDLPALATIFQELRLSFLERGSVSALRKFDRVRRGLEEPPEGMFDTIDLPEVKDRKR